MKVFRNPEEVDFRSGTAITIGTFDGVHLGHKKLISRLTTLAKQSDLASLVFTFEPHPRLVLFPDQKDLRLLTTPEERAELIADLNVDYLLEFPFSKEFSQIDPEVYVKDLLVSKLKAKKIVIGYDHRFGHMRKGSIKLLQQMSSELGFEVEEIPAQDIDEINISSTRIRKAIEEGNIKLANSFLGYDYFVTGAVVEGKKLGRTLGYPTANLEVKNEFKLIPRPGVYAVTVKIGDELKKGMMSIGKNPTTDKDDALKLEVNIFDHTEDLYGKTIRVHFAEFLRNEEKFAGLEELKTALANDRIRTLEVLKNYK